MNLPYPCPKCGNLGLHECPNCNDRFCEYCDWMESEDPEAFEEDETEEAKE